MEDLICARNRGGGARYRMIIQEQEQEQDQDPDQEAPTKAKESIDPSFLYPRLGFIKRIQLLNYLCNEWKGGKESIKSSSLAGLRFCP